MCIKRGSAAKERAYQERERTLKESVLQKRERIKREHFKIESASK
jgi:hypothetical protein